MGRGGQGGRRAAVLLAGWGLLFGVSVPNGHAARILSPSGPIAWLESTPSLGCAALTTRTWTFNWALGLRIAAPAEALYGPGSRSACGTVIAVNGTVYGPELPPRQTFSGEELGPWFPNTLVPVSENLTGAGTAGDPFVLTTVADAGATGVRVERIDTYVEGEREVRSQISVNNLSGGTRYLRLATFGHCGIGTFTFAEMTGWWAQRPDESAVQCSWIAGGNYSHGDGVASILSAEGGVGDPHMICDHAAFVTQMADVDISSDPGCSWPSPQQRTGEIAVTWDEALSPGRQSSVQYATSLDGYAFSDNGENRVITGTTEITPSRTAIAAGEEVDYTAKVGWIRDGGRAPYALMMRLPRGAEYVPDSVDPSLLVAAPSMAGRTLLLPLRGAPTSEDGVQFVITVTPRIRYTSGGSTSVVARALGYGVLFPRTEGPVVAVSGIDRTTGSPEVAPIDPPRVAPSGDVQASSEREQGEVPGALAQGAPPKSGPTSGSPTAKGSACKKGEACAADAWIQAAELVQGPSGTRLRTQPRKPAPNGKPRAFAQSHLDAGGLPVASSSTIRIGAVPQFSEVSGLFQRWIWPEDRRRARAAPVLVAGRSTVLRVFPALAGGAGRTVTAAERRQGKPASLPIEITVACYGGSTKVGEVRVSTNAREADPAGAELEAIASHGKVRAALHAANIALPAEWFERGDRVLGLLISIRPVSGWKQASGASSATDRLWLRNVRPTRVTPSVGIEGNPSEELPIVVRWIAGQGGVTDPLRERLQSRLPVRDGAVSVSGASSEFRLAGDTGDLSVDAWKDQALFQLRCSLEAGSAEEDCNRGLLESRRWAPDTPVAASVIATRDEVGGAAFRGSNSAVTQAWAAPHELGHMYGLSHAGYLRTPGDPMDWHDVDPHDPYGSGMINSRYLAFPGGALSPGVGLIGNSAGFEMRGEGPYDHPTSRAQAEADSDNGARSWFDEMSYARRERQTGFSVGQWNYLAAAMSQFRVCDPAILPQSSCRVQVHRFYIGDPRFEVLASGGM